MKGILSNVVVKVVKDTEVTKLRQLQVDLVSLGVLILHIKLIKPMQT
jgi:hypothetical protein